MRWGRKEPGGSQEQRVYGVLGSELLRLSLAALEFCHDEFSLSAPVKFILSPNYPEGREKLIEDATRNRYLAFVYSSEHASLDGLLGISEQFLRLSHRRPDPAAVGYTKQLTLDSLFWAIMVEKCYGASGLGYYISRESTVEKRLGSQTKSVIRLRARRILELSRIAGTTDDLRFLRSATLAAEPATFDPSGGFGSLGALCRLIDSAQDLPTIRGCELTESGRARTMGVEDRD